MCTWQMTTECDICYMEYTTTTAWTCFACANRMCTTCHARLQDPRCPFCRYSIAPQGTYLEWFPSMDTDTVRVSRVDYDALEACTDEDSLLGQLALLSRV